tara:strand:+ start:288 stop:1085 length:798 start_codon:yes stop_codon:yes gene_type:complete
MYYIFNTNIYKKYREIIKIQLYKIIQIVILKQLTKIINLVIHNSLKTIIKIDYKDLIPYYEKFEWNDLLDFFGTIIITGIFNKLDNGGLKIPISIYKRLYMKDSKYNITDDKKYLIKIIEDKNWSKFSNVYTLNRIIRLLVNKNNDNSILLDELNKIINKFMISFNHFSLTWSILTICNYNTNMLIKLYSCKLALLSNLLFITKVKNKIIYLSQIFFFLILSLFLKEDILLLLFFEIVKPLIQSDTFKSYLKYFYENVKSIFNYD